MHVEDAEDLVLINETLQGNINAYSALLDKYKHPIFNLVFRLTGNYHETEDLFQDIFVKAYKNLPQFTPGKSFFSWIYTIALNHTRNHIKHKKILFFIPLIKTKHDAPDEEYEPVFIDHSQHIEENLQKKEDVKLVNEVLKKLPYKYKEILVLRYQQDLSYEEISRITGLPKGTVENRLFRASKLLEKTYKIIAGE